ncbi:MAG: hypothetical protein QMC41_05020, partial [Halioglobus sp.]
MNYYGRAIVGCIQQYSVLLSKGKRQAGGYCNIGYGYIRGRLFNLRIRIHRPSTGDAGAPGALALALMAS